MTIILGVMSPFYKYDYDFKSCVHVLQLCFMKYDYVLGSYENVLYMLRMYNLCRWEYATYNTVHQVPVNN